MEGYVHPDFGAVTERFHRLMSKGEPPGGGAVAVYHRGELVVDAWTGVRDASGTPWDRDTMAMSFSTTKGVVATVVHRLADRGALAYDEPVATYWPEFAAAGKDRITIRHLLTHQAGLHPVRSLVGSAENLLDWEEMVTTLAAREPQWEPGIRPGYHALTYGWLVGEVIRRVTGSSVNDAVQRELAEPLGLEGFMIGVPPEHRDRVADLLIEPETADRVLRTFHRLGRLQRYEPLLEALVVDDFFDVAVTEQIHDAELPAANGVFTARDLARMYAALATPDAFDEQPLLSPATLAEATRMQTAERDAVMLFKMRWRLGYHVAATSAGLLPEGFGHFGFGGSGAWGDPASGLAVAMVLNRVGGSTPFADTRLLRIGGAAVRAARRRDGQAPVSWRDRLRELLPATEPA